MFQWFVSIFVIASGIILFAAWGRAIRAKQWIVTEESTRDWMTFRALTLIALLCEIVLLIISLIGLPRTFAWLASIYLIYFSVVFYFAVSLFRGLLSSSEGTPVSVTDEIRDDLAAIEEMAATLKEHGASTADDLKQAASHILQKAKDLGGLLGRKNKE